MRVFVLGAGAAVHAGYPLGRHLLREISKMVRAKNPTDDHDYMIKRDCLAELESRGIDLAHGDCEEIVNDLEQRNRDWCLVDTLRACVLELFDETLAKDKASAYKIFATQVLRSADVIITFNYDTSLELELKKAGRWRIQDGYGFPPYIDIQGEIPPSDVKVLKLHGSVNWLRPLRTTTEYVTPQIVSTSLEILGNPKLVAQRSSQVVPPFLLVMPSRKKLFDSPSKRFWDRLWRQARNALQSASKIYLLGYSLPKADARARELILGSSNREAKITVSCGGDTASICKEFTEHGSQSGVPSPARFEDWVEEQCRN